MTQAGFYARIYLHRLPAEDRDAALALLDEAAAARRVMRTAPVEGRWLGLRLDQHSDD